MKIGVQLPEVERVVRWPEYAQLARLAETIGFDSLWIGDHYLYRRDGTTNGPWEAWSLLAALAAVTERISLAPFVASLTFHNPAVLAKKAATVDEIADGRLILGVGAGWNETEYRAFGFPFDRRVARFAEAFTIVRRLLDGETVTIDGEFTTLDECALLPTSKRAGGRIPLMVGSSGERMLELTLPYADAWNAWFLDFENRPHLVAGLLDRLADACARVGRDPATIETSVALLLDFGSTSPRAGSINPIGGSPGEMAHALFELADLGIDHVQLVLDPIDASTIERAGQVLAIVRAGG